MPIPHEIPAGARIVVRTYEGVDPADQRMKFRDFVGHVRSWDGRTLELMRDAAANGSRPDCNRDVRCVRFLGEPHTAERIWTSTA